MANITILGNLGQDPELRYTQSGTAIVSVNIASRRNFKQQGEDYKTDWFRLTFFGKSAENFANFTHKGSQVYVEGEPQNDEWKDKDGNNRTTFQVNVQQWRLLDKKNDQLTATEQIQNNHKQDPITQNSTQINIDDNSLPF